PAQGLSDLSIGATLEYGIRILNAKHIFQISHTDCAFIKGLIDPQNPDSKLLTLGDFLPKLLTQAGNAISGSQMSLQKEGGKRYLVEELLRVGFENLMTYPWIVDKVWGNQLELHGCYIDKHTDTLRIFSPITDEFEDFNPK
ncbi:MAG: carbonic anhydrase, partial [Rhodospirillaceae bacterium]